MNMQTTPPEPSPAPAPVAPTPPASTPPAPAPNPEGGDTAGAPPPAPAPAAEGAQNDEAAKAARNGVQQRIDELTRLRHEAERRATYWQQVATQPPNAAPAPGASPSSAPAASPEPRPEQFDDYGQYIQALSKWQASAEVNRTLAASAEQQAQQARVDVFRARQDQLRTNIPDYDSVVGASAVPVQPHVLEALLDCNRGPELTYHFAKNPQLLTEMNSMDPRAVNREIGRLEATLPPVVAPPSVRNTNTPAPPNPVGAGGSSAADVASMPMEQYVQHRKSQGALWAR